MEEKREERTDSNSSLYKENDTPPFRKYSQCFEYFRLIYLGFPTVLYEITDYPTKNFKTQSASFEKEPFCQNRGIGAKNK